MSQTFEETASIVCRNKDCSKLGIGGPHIRRYGKTRKGIQRYQCKICNATFTQTKGTFFYNLHTTPDLILECFVRVAQNQKLSHIRRLTGVKEDTLVGWMRQAAKHNSEVESLLSLNYQINQAQLDLFWSQVNRYC